ncbi:MAG: hypothetical protein AAFR61_30780 [Bacteroidota bacterium]
MRTSVLFLLTCLFVACQPESPAPTDPPSMRVQITGEPEVAFSDFSGEINTDYETSKLVKASFSATNEQGDTTLTITLDDQDENAFPFRDALPFKLEPGSLAKATFTYLRGVEEVIGLSGEILVTDFERGRVDGQDVMYLSGTMAVNTTFNPLIGLFANLPLRCGECE